YSHVSTVYFYNDTTPPEIYTLSLHDALPISRPPSPPAPWTPAPSPRRLPCCGRESRPTSCSRCFGPHRGSVACRRCWRTSGSARSEEHTSELQSRGHLVCRLLLEIKKQEMGG